MGIVIGVLFMSVVAVVGLVIAFAGGQKAVRRMTPAEEAKYEIHPTVSSETVEITTENVKDIIDMTIEEGVDHPALRARKNQK